MRVSNSWPVVKLIILVACVAVGVLMMILFGFPLIEDLIRGVDPAERYQPKVNVEFDMQSNKNTEEAYQVNEMYLSDLKTKNDPYVDNGKIIFTTRQDTSGPFRLDAVAIYDIATETVQVLENVEKKYDNLLSPVMSGDTAVWVDSLADGGGRIVGYDLKNNKQFLIKEFAYAIPTLSLSGDLLTFMQWAGPELQRLYVYNVRTHEEATVRLYEGALGNSASDISTKDMVWSEYKDEGAGLVSGKLKRIAFSGDDSYFENFDFGNDVFEPKTNGKDIVYKTTRNISGTDAGDLMLSTGGGAPAKIAENVLNYDIGDNFVAYTKDDTIFICFTDQQKTVPLTSEISKNLLVSVNGNALTYYDITDGVLVDEVVMYATVE